jgi:uncharacterized repeat protein (TIGR01451 family)
VDDPKLGAQLGTSLQFDGGDRILIGAPFDRSNAGAAYLFEKHESWMQSFKFLPPDGGAFGRSVAILGNQVFMGGFKRPLSVDKPPGAVATCPFGTPPPCASTINNTDHQSTALTGQTVIYQIDVVAAIPGSRVSDPFPPELEMVGWCRGKGCTNFVQQPLVDTLPTGGDVTYLVRGRVRATTGEITNQVCVDGNVCQETCRKDIDPVRTLPAVSCVKTGPGQVNAGKMATYTIVVSNQGGQAANNVILRDPASSGLQFISASAPCSGGFPCALGTVRARQSLPPVRVKLKVPNGCAAPTSVTNTANVVGSNAPEESCSMTTAVRPQADLGISMSAPAQVMGGGTFRLPVVVTNAGPRPAQGATVDVSVGTAAIIDPVPGCTSDQPNHFTCLLGDLPCGGSTSRDFTILAPACAGCTAGNLIDLTAKAESQTSDPTLPNLAMATVQVTCPIGNLSITQTDSPDPVVPGQGVVYDVAVKNAGASAVTGAVVRDDFPSELQGVRWCRGAGCTPNLLPPLADTLDLAAGETRIYRLSGIVQPMCSGVLHNQATITPPAGICDDPSDNQSVEETQVAATGVHAFCAGISGPLTELSPMTQTFLLINCGPANQADNPGDEFTDVLPAGLTLTSATATSGTASTLANTARWNGAIPMGGTVTITLTAIINAGTAGTTLCNQATVAYDADGDGINESTRLSNDPDEPGPADPCCFRVIPAAIPALSGNGLAALTLLLAGLAMLRLRRRPL